MAKINFHKKIYEKNSMMALFYQKREKYKYTDFDEETASRKEFHFLYTN